MFYYVVVSKIKEIEIKIATKTENLLNINLIFQNYRERSDFGMKKGFSSLTFMKIYVLCLFQAFFC